MKITILTPSFNQGRFIEKTILSILNQDYGNIEHIIIDGGSDDETVAILKKYPHLKWVSEPDEGQADALNKGLAMATGDIIGWINSDDYYAKNIFKDVVTHFNSPSTHWIIGNITHIYLSQNIHIPVRSPKITFKTLIEDPDIVKQQGVFFRKEFLNSVGGWRKNFFMVMDYDLWVRMSKVHQPKMVDKNYAFFTWHPEQKSTIKNHLTQTEEICSILKTNGASTIARLHLRKKKYLQIAKGLLKSILIRCRIISKQYESMPISASKTTQKKP